MQQQQQCQKSASNTFDLIPFPPAPPKSWPYGTLQITSLLIVFFIPTAV